MLQARSRFAVLVLTLGALALSAPTAGQKKRKAAERERPLARFMERIDVNVVNVEVVVTRNDEPVYDLTRESFRILDDDEEMPISNFYVVEKGRRAGSPVLPPGAVPVEEWERSHIVVLVDNAFLHPSSRRQALRELRRHLERVRGDDNLIMVATKDSSVKVLQSFTNDPYEIAAALDVLEKGSSSGGMRANQERFIKRQIETGAAPNPNPGFGASDPAEEDSQGTMAQLLAHAQEVSSAVRRSTQTVDHFLSSLAGLPGRKAVLYLADGLPLRPAEYLFRLWFQKYSDYARSIQSAEEGIQQYDMSHHVFEMLASANANRVAFYPISIASNALLRGGSARESGGLSSAAFTQINVDPASDALDLMARVSGGALAHNVGAIDDMIDQLAMDLDSYYSLGFRARHGGDGKTHRIRVEVDEPGVKVRYLSSYRDKDGDQQIRDLTLSGLFLEAGENPLEAWLELGEPQKQKKNRYLVPVVVKFPLAKLMLIPQGKTHVGGVSICVIVRDKDGQTSDPRVIPVPVSIPNEKMLAANSTAAAWPTQLAVRSGLGQTLGISIRDDVSALVSTFSVRLDVPSSK